ncbi:MAG: hypothetical protein EOP49_04365 [Sphingobacteriales bacterium]|nr:MAG: hypothetical protein EOP49_04365 [Sphingobacteriales bacterium]
MKTIFSFFLLIVIPFVTMQAQNRNIKGRVLTEDLRTAPLISIKIDDSVEVGKTDLNGFFEINIPPTIQKLLIKGDGYIMDANITLLDSCNEVEVVVMARGTYDFISLKKADRLRKKRFKKLPASHLEAFSRGLFKTQTPCYKREYTP